MAIQIKRQFHFDDQIVDRILQEEENDPKILQEYILQAADHIYALESSNTEEGIKFYLSIIHDGLNNDHCPPDVHRELIAYSNKMIQRFVIDSYMCPSDVLVEIISTNDIESPLFYEAIANLELPMEQLLAYVSMETINTRVILHSRAAERLAHDPESPPEVLRAIVNAHVNHTKTCRYLLGVARNPNCPTDVLYTLVSDDLQLPTEVPNIKRSIQQAIFNNPNCTEDLRAIIALKLT